MPLPVKSPTATPQGPRPTGIEDRRAEGAVAPAQQDRHVVGAVVGDDQVLDAVAGEVGRDHVGGDVVVDG